MTQTLVSSSAKRLRLLGWLEGSSLLLLLGVAVPLKYMYHEPAFVRLLGPVHGLLFILFIFQTIHVGIELGWKFRQTTWKVLLACLIPFGTFYINTRILHNIKA